MKVLYHLTVPPSPMAACDAVVQAVETLRAALPSSQVNHLYPGRQPGTRFPRRWWGWQQWRALRRLDRQVDLHHIFNPDLFPFSAMRLLKKPIVYTAVTGLGHTTRATAQKLAAQVHTLAVPTEQDRDRLAAWGIENTVVIRAGIDTSRFTYTPPPADTPFTLVMGSAPWTEAQFRSKGVEALLAAAQQQPDLHFIFLWRGLLADEIHRRVQAAKLQEQVTILNEQVDVNRVLAGAHASVVLAEKPELVKAFPHSLLESLVAGKPVLVSRALPLAKYVREHECGVVVTAVTTNAFLTALNELQQRYDLFQQNARPAAVPDFGLDRFVQAHRDLYRRLQA